MKKKLLAAAIFLTAFSLSVSGYCSSVITAHVLSFGTYGNGNVYVALDQPLDESGCALPYIELPANAAAAKTVVAAAALAVATGATVNVKTDGCLNGTPSFSGNRPAWFLVNNP